MPPWGSLGFSLGCNLLVGSNTHATFGVQQELRNPCLFLHKCEEVPQRRADLLNGVIPRPALVYLEVLRVLQAKVAHVRRTFPVEGVRNVKIANLAGFERPSACVQVG